jgi:type II secretory ATPase GspE/PulE/Tfp pilus assembly ATPase PilB-like protein
MKLSELGYDKSQLQVLEHINEIPNGLILVTGPTGSGKTTTFHSLIDSMDKESLKIITIEDPVERQIEGIQQIQVNENIGFTFESIFRRVLRQDPDVIMVGEIRDNATAELAIRASLTGHKILATLHTNDSVSSISRLRNLGIESFLISSVLKYSIAQRLVRKICKDCKGKGCNKCSNTGYNGRTVVTEIMKVDDTISQMINENKTDLEIKEYLKKNHVLFLIDDAKRKVEAKITDTKELKREGLL